MPFRPQQFWIPARKAVELVEADVGHEAIYTICKRAHADLLKSRAKLLIIDEHRTDDAILPNYFWWAEGEEALEQNWDAGDFSTVIEGGFLMRAFGVQFDFGALREIMSPATAAQAARSVSVISDPTWVTAMEARRFIYNDGGANPVTAGDYLIDQCKFGFVPARAVLMQKSLSGAAGAWSTEEREWDVPDWFWQNFTVAGQSSQNWERGNFRGRGRSPEGNPLMQLTGVHFLRSALEALAPSSGPSTPEPNQNKGGRPRKDFWDEMWCAIWGEVYRGDLEPKNQADIERAMMSWIEGRSETASESTVKPLARRMFAEMQR